MKLCKRCGEIKPLAQFHKHPLARDGHHQRCKKCAHEVLKEERKKPEAKARFKIYQRRASLKKFYGITDKQYDAMLVNQNGRCMICGKTRGQQNGAQRRLHVDHDAKTKKVRALLCNGCNRGLGLFSHHPGLLKRAAAYLEFFHGKI